MHVACAVVVRLAVVFALLTCLLGWRSARAAEVVRPIHVVYEGVDGCPSADAFRLDLARRSPRIVFAEGRDVDNFDVHVAATAMGFEATLASGAADPHVERGAKCWSVVSAVALTLALSIDPSSKTDSTLEPPSPVVPLSVSPLPGTDTSISPRATPSPPPSEGRIVAMALGVDVLTGVFAPGLGGVTLAIESRSPAAARVPVVLRGRLLLAGQGEAGSMARVSLGALGLDACVFEVGGGRVHVRPCVGLEPGVAGAEARGATPSRGASFWLSTSARLRGDVAITERLGVSIEGAALVTLVRPRFVLDPPGRTVAEAGPLGAEVALSGWLSFP